MTRCTNCEKEFIDDDDLTVLDESKENFYRGCPECQTDEYLMDVPDVAG